MSSSKRKSSSGRDVKRHVSKDDDESTDEYDSEASSDSDAHPESSSPKRRKLNSGRFTSKGVQKILTEEEFEDVVCGGHSVRDRPS